MAKLLNLFTAIEATGATPEGDGDGGFLADLTKLNLEQLMNLSVGGRSRTDPEEALANRGSAQDREADGLERSDPLPADLTTLGLAALMNLRVRPARPDEPEEDEKKFDDDEDPSDEDSTVVAQVKADAPADDSPPPANDGGGADFAEAADEEGGDDEEILLDSLMDDNPETVALLVSGLGEIGATAIVGRR